jgi:predicted O-methyltransferase YrrM
MTMDEYSPFGNIGNVELAALVGWSWPVRSYVRLVSKAVTHPDRALLRLLLHARLASRNAKTDHARFLAWLAGEFNVDAAALDAEYHNSMFHRSYLARLHGLHDRVAPLRSGTSGLWTLKALYLLVRAARPRLVVESGVLYGASSAHILAALAANGEGELHSIDLAHDETEPPGDFLVPDGLRDRWHLIVGDSRSELPALLEELGTIDCFHHDSLHTFEHMTWEYQTALPHLAAGGVLSSHDVLVAHSMRRIFQRNAFPVFCDRHGLRWSTFQNSGFALVDAPGTTR